MAWWDLVKTETTYPWNPTPGPGQRNDYSIPMPVGTPIVSPVSGIVLPEHTNGGGLYSYFGRKDWGGEVDVLTSLSNYPGGVQDVNVLHFDTVNVKPGDVVIAGRTVLGTSGGQTSGGNWPSLPRYSTGPHIGVGVHAADSWNRMYNPGQLVSDLVAGRSTSSMPTNNQLQSAGLGWLPHGGGSGAGADAFTSGNTLSNTATSGSGNPCDGLSVLDPRAWLCLASSKFSTITQWMMDPLRILKIAAGFMILLAAFGLFVVSAFGPDLAAAGLTAAGMPEAAAPVRQALARHKGPSGQARAAIQTAGAVQGKKTLNTQRQQAAQQSAGYTAAALRNFFVQAGRRGGQQAAANRAARRQQGGGGGGGTGGPPPTPAIPPGPPPPPPKATPTTPPSSPMQGVNISSYFQQQGPGTQVFTNLKNKGAFGPGSGKRSPIWQRLAQHGAGKVPRLGKPGKRGGGKKGKGGKKGGTP